MASSMKPLLLLLLAALCLFSTQGVHLRASKQAAAASQQRRGGAALAAKDAPEEGAAEEGGEEAPAEEGAEAAEGEGAAEEGDAPADAEAPATEQLPPIKLGECQAVTVQAPELAEVEECVCGEGQFWNWRTKRCTQRGGLGYECGWFPEELHDVVCQKGLTCKATGGDEHYASHGKYRGTDGVKPATCSKCTADDNCPTESPDCHKKVSLEGDVCVTVRVAKEAPQTDEADEETEATEGEDAGPKLVFSKASSCMSVARAKQLLGVTGVDNFDMKAAKEVIELGETRAMAEACKEAAHKEPEQEPAPAAEEDAPAEGEEAAEGAEGAEGEESAADGEEAAPAEGEEAPADD